MAQIIKKATESRIQKVLVVWQIIVIGNLDHQQASLIVPMVPRYIGM